MIPAAFDYARAKSVNDALKALAAGDGTKLIAGGQSLLPLLKFRMAETPRLVDIGWLDELKGIEKVRDGVRIGATTTYRELVESTLLGEQYPMLVEATEGIGDLQVRNVGTIGGSIAHADPASDMPALMLALDAKFTLVSGKGQRTVAAREFFQGSFMTALKEHELITGILLPTLPAGAGSSYVSFEQKASGYALVGAAAVVARSRGKIAKAALAFTGISDTPFLSAAAKKLVDTTASEDVIAKVAEEAVASIEVNDDIHAPADYRRQLGKVAARRALTEAAQRAG